MKINPLKAQQRLPQKKEKEEDKTGYFARAKQDKERFDLAVQVHFSTHICFRTQEQMNAFLDLSGWGWYYGKWVDGTFIRPIKPRSKPQPIFAPKGAKVTFNDVNKSLGYFSLGDTVVYHNNLETDSVAEAEALQQIWTEDETGQVKGERQAIESPFYFSVIFQSEEQCHGFVRHVKYDQYAFLYISGLWIAQQAKIKLPDAKLKTIPKPPPDHEYYINGFWLAKLHDYPIEHLYLANKDAKPNPQLAAMSE